MTILHVRNSDNCILLNLILLLDVNRQKKDKWKSSEKWIILTMLHVKNSTNGTLLYLKLLLVGGNKQNKKIKWKKNQWKIKYNFKCILIIWCIKSENFETKFTDKKSCLIWFCLTWLHFFRNCLLISFEYSKIN